MAGMSAGRWMGIVAVAALPLPVGSLIAQAPVPDVSRELQVARQMLATDQVKRAFAYVEGSRDETVQEWLSLCNAYGPSGDEIYRSNLIYKLFRIYGLQDVRIDEHRNVIGVRHGAGQGPKIVFNAHHDAVPLLPRDQPIEAFVADNRIWCPSGGDDLEGVVQLLSIVRALNAANIQTQGDLWFASFTGEEVAPAYAYDASPGAGYFVQSNYPNNIDWRKGDIMIQFHGGGGGGVATGSTPVRYRTQLRIFVPFTRDRWGPHAIDALAPVLARIVGLRDRRVVQAGAEEGGQHPGLNADSAMLYMNCPMVDASPILNAPAKEVRIRCDLRSVSEARIQRVNRDIEHIADSVTKALGPGYSWVYEIMSKNGIGLDVRQEAIEGWDKVNNPPARMVAATAQALYGGPVDIEWRDGCGDCVRAYKEGMPAFSFRGSIVDLGGGHFERGNRRLRSDVRKMTAGHDVAESVDIDAVWAGIKHGVLFAVSYAGLSAQVVPPVR